MQNTYPDPSRHISDEDLVSPENISSPTRAKKRQRSQEKSPDLNNSMQKGKNKKQQQKIKKPVDSGKSFGCPFYKFDPVKYGGEKGCSSWANANIETVIRHHILNTHRKRNRESRHINDACFDACFEEVRKLKVDTVGLSAQERSEKMWMISYWRLFKTGHFEENDVPDPYFGSNPRGLDVQSFEKYLKPNLCNDRFVFLNVLDFARKIESLKAERKREIQKVERSAAAEERQIQDKLAEIRETRDAQIQEICTLYDKKMDDASLSVREILVSGSKNFAEADVSKLHTSTVDAGAKAESLAGLTSLPPNSDPSGQALSLEKATHEQNDDSNSVQLSDDCLTPITFGDLDELFNKFTQ